MNRAHHAVGLYVEGIGEGKINHVINHHMGDSYIQHSTGVKSGKEGFKEFFEEFIKKNPIREINVFFVLVDGKYVFLNVYQNLNNGEAQWITSDLFRLDESDRVVEHWDVIDTYTVEKNDLILGDFEILESGLDEIRENKNTIRCFLTEVMQNRRYAKLGEYCSEDIVHHSKMINDGLPEYQKYIQENDIEYDFVFKIIGQGNFVIAYSQVLIGGSEYAVFDVFRLENRKVVEHWDNKEMVPKHEDLYNTGKF